jgi:hypothetical protein
MGTGPVFQAPFEYAAVIFFGAFIGNFVTLRPNARLKGPPQLAASFILDASSVSFRRQRLVDRALRQLDDRNKSEPPHAPGPLDTVINFFNAGRDS